MASTCIINPTRQYYYLYLNRHVYVKEINRGEKSFYIYFIMMPNAIHCYMKNQVSVISFNPEECPLVFPVL